MRCQRVGEVVKFSHVSEQQFSLVGDRTTSYSASRCSVEGCHVNPIQSHYWMRRWPRHPT